MRQPEPPARNTRTVLAIVTVDIMAYLLILPWLKGLQDAGFDVHIACAKGKYYDRLVEAGFTMHPVSFRRTFNPFAHIIPFFQVVSILRSTRFHIVNTHSPIAAAVGRLAAAFAHVDNIVYTVHGFYFHDRMTPLLRFQLVALEWFFGRWTDGFMFVSDEDRRTAQRLGICGANARACTIYNGVDVDTYHPGPRATSEALRIHHALPDRPVVGIVGRIVREKGHREFLDMAIGLTQSGFDLTFLVVGDSLPSDRDQFGPEFRASVDKAGLAGRFVFTGLTDQVPDYLRLMDIFVLPSYREGFPRSILEAMATGLAVVSTNVRGCREAVEGGITGLIVPPADANALRQAVESLLVDPGRTKQMGARGRQLTCDRYDFHKVSTQFVSFIQAIGDSTPAQPSPSQPPQPRSLSMALLILLFVLLALYVVPNLMASLLAMHYHGAWAFILAGDGLGCVLIGLLAGWNWGVTLYLALAILESLLVARGIWSLRQVIWFSNFVPVTVILGLLTPAIFRARNWRIKPTKEHSYRE